MPDIDQLQLGTRYINEDGTATLAFISWAESITDLDPIIGTGSPEGPDGVLANQYRRYVDETDPANPVEYMKMLPNIGDDKSQGWAII